MLGALLGIVNLIILVGISAEVKKVYRILEALGLSVLEKPVRLECPNRKSTAQEVATPPAGEEPVTEKWTAAQFQEYIRNGGKYK